MQNFAQSALIYIFYGLRVSKIWFHSSNPAKNYVETRYYHGIENNGIENNLCFFCFFHISLLAPFGVGLHLSDLYAETFVLLFSINI